MKKLLKIAGMRGERRREPGFDRLLRTILALFFMIVPWALISAEHEPDSLERAVKLVEENRFDEARKELEVLLEKNPDDATLRTIARLLDEREEQVTGVPPTVARQPTMEPDWQGVLDALLTHLERSDIQLALEEAEEAEKLKEFRHAIGRLSQKAQEALKEIALAKKLLKELPENVPIEATVAPEMMLHGGREDLKLVTAEILTLRQAIEEATGQSIVFPASPKEGPADSAVDFQQINRLVQEGNYMAAMRFLKRATDHTPASERAKIESMLAALSGYRAGRREAVGARNVSSVVGADTPYAITHLTGSRGDWTALVAKRSIYTEQMFSGFCEQWPEEWIGTQFDAGYRITALSGDKHGWCVVMSKCKDNRRSQQMVLGPAPIDQKMDTRLLRLFNQGYRITAVGGFMNDWVLVLEPDTGFGMQTLLKPDYHNDDEMYRWWKTQEELGYTLTSANGRFALTPSGDGMQAFFLVVTTSGLESNQQTLELNVPLPSEASANDDPPLHLIAGGGPNGRYLLVRDGVPFAGSEVRTLRASTFAGILIAMNQIQIQPQQE